MNGHLIALSILGAMALWAQRGPEQPDITVDAKMRAQVIEGALDRLNQSYVFPDVARKMAEAVRERQAHGEFDKITSAKELAQRLTEHLRAVSHDRHLRIDYFYEPPPRPEGPPNPRQIERRREQMAFNNFGFEKVERLAGNVGYLDLRAFMDPEFAGETAVAAMNFLGNSSAIIIDLRQNGGGTPAMVALLSSYLFGSEVVHLNDLYWRPRDETHQWWTLPYVPGKRLTGKDVYVLTSRRTFSAAEEFTYNLKNLKRATIVGENTGGGAHPGGPQPINDHFFVWVPSGRAINPISKKNWEGEGVQPDVEAPAEQALKTAHLIALKKISEKTEDPERKGRLQQLIADLEAK